MPPNCLKAGDSSVRYIDRITIWAEDLTAVFFPPNQGLHTPHKTTTVLLLEVLQKLPPNNSSFLRTVMFLVYCMRKNNWRKLMSD